jgi:hypothetical protein
LVRRWQRREIAIGPDEECELAIALEEMRRLDVVAHWLQGFVVGVLVAGMAWAAFVVWRAIA